MPTGYNCNICKVPLTAHESFAQDCGGDCLLCMADAGDIGCIAAVLQIARAARTPLTDKEVANRAIEGHMFSYQQRQLFRAGVRYAERVHLKGEKP